VRRPTSCSASALVKRIDSFTVEVAGSAETSRSAGASASPSSRCTARRTTTDTLTRSACARATSAAFKPRMSTVTKS
jgi:hypothetical protein